MEAPGEYFGHDAGNGTIDYYKADVVTVTDYYSGGMQMPGRTYSQANSSYHYGYNKQERSTELNDNLYTAKYWEYDSRIGRRWNLDPIYNTDISRYAVNGNNPNYFTDPNGDYKHKFFARVANFFNGGDGIKQNTNKQSKFYGQWSYGKNTNHDDGEGGVVVNPYDHYGRQDKRNVGSGGLWSPNIEDTFAETGEKVYNASKEAYKYVSKNRSEIWNSEIARAIIPDYVTFSYSVSGGADTTVNRESTFTLLLRGKDPGLYFNKSISGGWASSI